MKYKIREKLFGANKASAIGTSLTLNDTVKYPINKLMIDGVCEQKTTTGKNLLDYVSNIKSSSNGLTNVINSDGSITTSGKPTVNYSQVIQKKEIIDELEDGQTYTISQAAASRVLYLEVVIKSKENTYTYLSCNLTERKSVTFTVDKSFFVSYIITILTTTTATFGDNPLTITNKYMLCKGTDTADTSFEPYTGNQPSPSPDFPQNISVLTGDIKLTSCEKNLLKLINGDYSINGINANVENGIVTLNGTPNNGTNLLKISNFNYVFKANTTYSLNVNPSYFIESAEPRLRLANNNGRNIVKDFYFTARTSKVSFSFSENTKVTELWIRTGTSIKYNDLVLKPQLNFGQPTSFEPYQDSSLNITIPENEFAAKLDDTYKDTLNVVYKPDGHYHLILNKMIGKAVLDGSTDGIWTVQSTNVKGKSRFRLDTSKFNMKNVSKINEVGKIISTSFSPVSVERTWFNYNGISIDTAKYIFIYSDEMSNLSLTDFKSWLSTHNLEIYYALETPYEVDLGIVDQLLTFDEITNIFTDSDLYPVINVDYYKGSLDISNYEFAIKEV